MAEIGRGFAVIGYDDSEVRAGMKRTGSALKGEMKSASSAASGELRRLQAAAAAAGTKATQTAARLSKATNTEANALGKLRVAQAQLNDVKAKGARGSAALVRAEEALAKAQRDAESATKEKSRALKSDEIAQRRAADATEEVKKASTQAAGAQDKLGKSGKDAGRKVGSGMDTAEKKTSRFSRTLRRASGALKGFAGGLAVGVSGAALIGGLRDAINVASEAEQAAGAAQAIFGKSYGMIAKHANAAAKNVGLANGEYLQLSTNLAAQLKNKGVKNYADETSKLMVKAADMAAMFGGTTAEAVDAINSALRGEIDPIERYGASFNQAAIETEALSSGLIKSKKEMTDSAKAAAVLNILNKQTADSTGTFAREAETYGGKLQRVSAVSKNLKESIGNALLPVAGRFADWMLNTGVPAVSGFMDAFKNSEGTAGQLRGALTDVWGVLKQVGQAFMSVGGFILQHRTAFTALAVVVGGAIAVYKTVTMAMAAYSAAMTAYRAVAAAATAAQMALNLAFLSNPITWVIIGIVALVAALVVLYKKNEAFRNFVNNAWASIKAAIGAVVTWVTGTAVPWLVNAWNWIKNGAVALWARMVAIWNGIKSVIGAVAGWVTATAVPWFANAWNWIRNGAVALWSRMVAVWNGIKSVIGAVAGWVTATVVARLANAWNWIRNGATSLWTAMRAIWNGIKAAISAVVTWIASAAYATWNRAANGFRSVGVNLQGAMRGIWNGIKSAISAVVTWHATVARAIWSRTSDSFKQVGMILWNAMRAIWNGIKAVISITVALMRGDIKRVISEFRNLQNKGVELKNRLVAAWTSLKNSIGRIAGQIRDGAIEGLKRAFTSLQDWVGKVRDGIVNVWNDMKGKVSEVTNWVKDKAIKPVLNAWNKVAGIVKLPQVDVSGWATGGYTGAGRKYEPAGIVHRDEYVIRKEATNRLRRTVGLSGLDYMNQTGRLPGHADGGLVGGVPGYARGGLAKPWPTYVAGVIRRLFPAVRSIGGYGSRGNKSDHPSGNALDIMVPVDSALGDAVAAWGLKNFAALKLKYIIWKQRINSGTGWRGMSNRGSITANHRDHPHFSFIHDTPGNPDALGVKLSPEEVAAALAGGGGGGTSMPFWFAPFQAVLDKVKGGIAGAVQAFGGHPFAQAMGGIPTALIDGLIKFVSEKFAVVGTDGGGDAPYTGPVGKGVEQWRGTVLQALSIMGQPASLANTVLRRMNQESGGNPNAVNNWDSNAKRGTPSQGLMQTIAPTYRAYAHPQHNKGMRDPLSNILASMRYALARYGSLSRAYNRKGGYAGGGLVKPTLYDTGGWLGTGTTVVQNNTGKPELVLTQEQLASIGKGGPSIIINGVKMDTVPDVMEAIRFAEARQRSGGRYARMG